MKKQWFCAQAVRRREIVASVSVAAFGFECYVPVIQRLQRVGRQVTEVSAPRFGTYIFVRFDRDADDWGRLMHERTHRRYFARVLCHDDNGRPRPTPVPDIVMDTIKAYRPPQTVKPEAYRYTPGEACTVYIGGFPMQAVFMGYNERDRPMIKYWMFGHEKVQEASAQALEPLTLDSGTVLYTSPIA